MLNVEPSNLVFLKTYNLEFDEIIITFTDQYGRLLEMEDKVNSRLFVIKQKFVELKNIMIHDVSALNLCV